MSGCRLGRLRVELRPDYDFVRPGRQTELSAALLIEFQSCGDVQLGNRDFSCPRAGAPIIRAREDDIALDHVSLNFFLVTVAKYEHSGWKLGRRQGCLLWSGRSESQTGCWRRIRRRLRVGRRLTVVRNPHPLTALVFQHQRLDRSRRWGRRRSGLHDDYLEWRRLRRNRLVFVVIVTRIEVRRQKHGARERPAVVNTGETDSRAEPGRDTCSSSRNGCTHAAHLRGGGRYKDRRTKYDNR